MTGMVPDEVRRGMLSGFGLGMLWMVLVWALPFIGAVALIAALSNKKS